MEKWFESQSRLVQIILLLIPVVNWVIEVGVRWSHALRKNDILKTAIALVVTVFGIFIGWLDVVWCLLFNHMILCD